MKKQRDTILKKDSKIDRILQVEDMIYHFLNKRGKFNLELNFEDKSKEKIFLDICEKICLRLNAFGPREEKDAVPPIIANAAIEIEKLIPKGEKISDKKFIIAFIKWAKKDLFKKIYIKPIPWELIDKVNKAREFELGVKNLDAVYDILDEYKEALGEIIASGRNISSIARELGMGLPQLQSYIIARSPGWSINQRHSKIKIENIEDAKIYIFDNGMDAMAERLGCSTTCLKDYLKKNYPEVMKGIKQHSKENKKNKKHN
jgi:hypothetical protein